jgi:signal transduction histidine kinase
MVIQVQLPEDKWLYLATVLPLSVNDLKNSVIDGRQITFLLIVTVLIVGVSYVVLSQEIRPFRSLARSATLMGANMETEEIKEKGSSETRAAIHAFNKMNRRIKAYLRDRDMFFNGISHDIHEELEWFDLNDFVEQCAAVHNQNQKVVRLHPGFHSDHPSRCRSWYYQ